MIVACPHCKAAVFPKPDQSCPSCGGSTTGGVEPARVGQAEAILRARELEEMERSRNRGGAGSRRLLGITLIAAGLLSSIWSLATAAHGGTYIVWTGAIVVGTRLILRGSSER